MADVVVSCECNCANNHGVHIENLCRKPRLVFVSVLQFGRKGFEPATYSLTGAPATDDAFTVGVERGRKTAEVKIDLGKTSVVVT
jgi:hypothetical protein